MCELFDSDSVDTIPYVKCINGTWDPAWPTCEHDQNLNSCPYPPSIDHGRVDWLSRTAVGNIFFGH